jgi:DNA-directed RNA polymerase subunit RPC12/RpoP
MAKGVDVDALLVEMYRCEECNNLYDEEQALEGGPLYECGECGMTFSRANSANDNHQCPDCHKFGSKVADVSCPDGCDVELAAEDALEYEGTIYVVREES